MNEPETFTDRIVYREKDKFEALRCDVCNAAPVIHWEKETYQSKVTDWKSFTNGFTRQEFSTIRGSSDGYISSHITFYVNAVINTLLFFCVCEPDHPT